MARILGLDYGKKRCGIAMTDVLQISINPIKTVETSNIFTSLEGVLNQEQIETLVVGWPLHTDGTETSICPKIQKLINRVQHHFPKLEIVKMDESYSSIDARSILGAMGKNQKFKKSKGNLDAISAVLIIKRYLDAER